MVNNYVQQMPSYFHKKGIEKLAVLNRLQTSYKQTALLIKCIQHFFVSEWNKKGGRYLSPCVFLP